MNTQANKILEMIEGLHQALQVDAGARRQLNKEVALYLGWYYYTPSQAKEKFKRTYKRGAWIHPDDCRDGNPQFCQIHGTEVHSNIPDFTSSRDALKSVRPKGWNFRTYRYFDGKISYFHCGMDKNTPFSSICANSLPTEELAELHAIIQAIQWERDNKEGTE